MARTILRSGKLRGEKIQYKDGIGCTVWYPFPNDEDAGTCFDFAYEDIDDLITLLGMIKQAQADMDAEEGT